MISATTIAIKIRNGTHKPRLLQFIRLQISLMVFLYFFYSYHYEIRNINLAKGIAFVILSLLPCNSTRPFPKNQYPTNAGIRLSVLSLKFNVKSKNINMNPRKILFMIILPSLKSTFLIPIHTFFYIHHYFYFFISA